MIMSSFFECLNSTDKRLVSSRIYARLTVNQSVHEGCQHIVEFYQSKEPHRLSTNHCATDPHTSGLCQSIKA